MGQLEQESVPSSRRSLLKAAVGAVGVVSLFVAGVRDAAAKVSPAAVGYQGSPKGSQKCSNCRLFEPPAACKSVSGPISPEGWCRIWAKLA